MKYKLRSGRKLFSPPGWTEHSRAAVTQMTTFNRLLCFWGKVFPPSLLSVRLQPHYGDELSSPWTCASDVTNNVSSRKWWRSPVVRFHGTGAKNGGSIAPVWMPGVSTAFVAKIGNILGIRSWILGALSPDRVKQAVCGARDRTWKQETHFYWSQPQGIAETLTNVYLQNYIYSMWGKNP